MTVHREHAMRSQFSFDLFLSFFVPRLLCSLGSVCFVAECQCIPVLVVTSLSDEVTEGSTEVTQSPTVLPEVTPWQSSDQFAQMCNVSTLDTRALV